MHDTNYTINCVYKQNLQIFHNFYKQISLLVNIQNNLDIISPYRPVNYTTKTTELHEGAEQRNDKDIAKNHPLKLMVLFFLTSLFITILVS